MILISYMKYITPDNTAEMNDAYKTVNDEIHIMTVLCSVPPGMQITMWSSALPQSFNCFPHLASK